MSEKKGIMPTFKILGPTKPNNDTNANSKNDDSTTTDIILKLEKDITNGHTDEKDSTFPATPEMTRQSLIQSDFTDVNFISSYFSSEGRQLSQDENKIVNETTRFHDGKIQVVQSRVNGKVDYLDIATIWNFLKIDIKQSIRTSEQILILSFYGRRLIIKRNQLNRRNVLDFIDQLGLCTNESLSKQKLGSALLDYIKKRLNYTDTDLVPDYIGFYKGVDGRWLYCNDKRNTWHWLLQKAGTCEEIPSLKQFEDHKPIITKPGLQKLIYLLFIYSAFVRIFHSIGVFFDKLIILVGDDTCRQWITEVFHLYQDVRPVIPLDCNNKQFRDSIDAVNASECVLVQAPNHYTSGQKVSNNVSYLKQKAKSIGSEGESGFFPIVLSDKITPISGVDTQECIYIPIGRDDFISSTTNPFFDDTYAIKPDSFRKMIEIFLTDQDYIFEDLNYILHSSSVDPEDVFQECVASMGAYFITGNGSFSPPNNQEKLKLVRNFKQYKEFGFFDSPESILLSRIRSYISEGGRIKTSTTLKSYDEFKKTELLYMTIDHENYIGIQPRVYKRIVSEIRDNYPSSRILKALRARGCIKGSSGENRFITTLTFKDGTAASVAVYLFKYDCIYMAPPLDDES